MSTILVGKQLSFQVKDKKLIDDVNLSFTAGEFTAIIGPNGAGKTTLLNLIDGDVKLTRGNITIANQDISTIDRLQLARLRAVLPQLGHVPFAIKAKDIVALGREPYRYSTEQQYNSAVIEAVLAQMDIVDLANHHYATLSGGEQHRVQIARTLAQIYHSHNADLSGKILFLDEPTNHLDVHHQYALMQLLKKLQQQGLTIIAVMHDLSLTLQFADHILLLHQAKKVGYFTPDELVENDALSAVYKMRMDIRWDNATKRYLLLPSL